LAYHRRVPATAGPRAAAFFDLDKTIIARSSSLAFSRPFYRGGLINRGAVLRSAYAQFVYLLGGADHDQMERMRLYLQELCAGWPVEQVQSIVAETVHDLIDPLIYAEAVELIDQHHAAGEDVVIVSSSGSEVVEPIGEMLGADHVVATRMVVEDGKYTGEIAFYAYGEHKAEAVRALAQERGYDLSACSAYSDSATDLPMLAEVGHPFAVNPDKALRVAAAERGWPVLSFANPVGLRRRVPPLPTRRVTLATVGAATAAGIVWYAGRRLSHRSV
jgi:HAD superfamily hydrolase (TIGR01490 family)